jgi:hypothetical protein
VMITKLNSGNSGISQAYWRNKPIARSIADCRLQIVD